MDTTRYLFYTGKGGVGKTSVACATAMNLANSGKKVLLVSTDPASNLDDVLEITVEPRPTVIPGITGLKAMNLDPEKAARDYREKVVGSYRGVLPDPVIASMEEQLSGACTVEIATFDLFTGLLTNPAIAAEYDHIIFDTAPTGHTLRLLALPQAWSGYLGEHTHGASCIGPLAGLENQQHQYQNTVSALSDPILTTLILVAKPEGTPLNEAARASHELGELGLTNQELVINGVLEEAGDDPVAEIFRQQQLDALEQMPVSLKKLPSRNIPLLPIPPVGLSGLRRLMQQIVESQSENADLSASIKVNGNDDAIAQTINNIPQGLEPIIEDLVRKPHGVILVMGKGGVGKTTIASALALALAKKGKTVHLSTTDPAAHLDLTLADDKIGNLANLSVSRIDPAVEVAAYREEVMAAAGAGLDADGQALLAEDLASPCTEEIAVFRAFARTVDRFQEGFVVLDTAPTGHTLLLLDNTQSYHRQVEQSTGQVPPEVQQLLPRLRDPELTHVILVTLAQATPVLEATRLQKDLQRAGIEPYCWVINLTWTGVTTGNPILKSLAQAEIPWLNKVTTLSSKVVRLPWQVQIPRGQEGLKQLL